MLLQSCSSLPGFTNLKNKMIRTVATLQNDQEMRATKAQQLQHINNWIESLGRYDQELGPDLPPVPREVTYGNGPLDPSAAAGATTTPGQHDRKQQHLHQHRGREQGGGGQPHHHQQQQQGPARSSSPKPITSTPPNVHKPQPINHVSPTTVSSTYAAATFPNNNGTGSGSSGPNNNAPYNSGGGGFHHQHFPSDPNALEEPYESLSRATMAMSQEVEPPRGDATDGSGGGKRHSQESAQKKNPNFSLKSWLKRDPRQRSSNDELPSPTGQSPQFPPHQSSSAKSPTTPFNKLRNSVVQKFAGGGSSKKSSEASKTNNIINAPVVPPKPPRALVDNEPLPSHQILFTPQQQQQQQQQPLQETEPKRSSQDMPEYEARDYQNFYYQSRRGSKERGFPTGHESAPSTLSSVTSRDFSPNKYEPFVRGDGSRHRDSSHDRTRYGSQERNLNPSNEALQTLPSPANADSQKESRGRNRAPIALNLGSNMSISDVYGRQEEDPRQTQQQQQQQQAEVAPQPQYPANHLAVEGGRDSGPHLPPQPSNVDSKRVKANPVPVYKAKLIPNYENQTKLDPRMEHGIRGQAEPVHQPPLGHFAQSSTSSEVYRQELQRKSEMYVGNYPQLSPLSQTPPGQGSHHNTPSNQALSQTLPNQGSSSYNPHSQALSQTPPNQGSYPLNQALSQPQANQTASSYPHSQTPSQIAPSQGSYPHPNQAPFSQTTPKGSANSVSARDGGVGPVNPNSPDYDDFQTPARRSASAQNILDRGYGTDGCRQSHTSDPSGPSHSYLASIGNFSASLGTPSNNSNKREEPRGKGQSMREPRDKSADSGAAQTAKVSTLINRWEKKHGPEEGMGGPLVDGQDRPPSMTSTPVARRKHPAAPGAEGEGGVRSATVHPQSQPQRHHQPPVTSSYDAQASAGMNNGLGQFVSGAGGPRSHGHHREREGREAYRQGNSPQHSHSPQRPQPQLQTPRSHAYPSPHHHHQQQSHHHQLPQQQLTSYQHQQQQQQQHSHPQHAHPTTNTYPPRSSHPPSRLPNDVNSNLDIPDSYSEQLRKVSHINGGGGGGKPSKPVPLPRHNIPGAMAVVKPTVMQQGQLTFMEI